MKAQDIELLAGISLSDGGISLPLHTVLRKRPFRITMKTPTTRSLIRISKRYLRIGVTPEEYDEYNPDFTRAMAEEALESGELFELKIQKKIPERSICIVQGSHATLSSAAQKLIELIREDIS